MALNDPSGTELQRQFSPAKIVNAGSWGMTLSDSARMLQELTTFCSPKVIVLFTFYGDFYSKWDKAIDWNRFTSYLYGQWTWLSYLREPDIAAYVTAWRHLDAWRTEGPKGLEYLGFDETGTVNLACSRPDDPPADLKRWDGYKYDKLKVNEMPHQAGTALATIVETATRTEARLVVVRTPMRSIAERSFYPERLSALWDDVRSRVEANHGMYIHVSGEDGYADELFADYAHLNGCGAKKLTLGITPVLADALSRDPGQHASAM